MYIRVYIYVFLIFYSFSTEGHKFISMYILLCVLPSLNKGFTYLLTNLLIVLLYFYYCFRSYVLDCFFNRKKPFPNKWQRGKQHNIHL